MEQDKCELCGIELDNTRRKIEGKHICPSCAKKLFEDKLSHVNKQRNVSTDGKCPKCGSDKIQTFSDSTKEGYGVGKGLCGGLLLGPFGLLCGFCGNKNETKTGRMCLNCGNKF